MPALTVAQLAALCGGEVEGDAGRIVSGANTLDEATDTDLAFAENEQSFETARSSRAGCLLVPSSFSRAGDWSVIRVDKPRLAFVRAVCALYPANRPAAGVHSTAVIAESARVGADCYIGACVTIGERTQIGEECTVSAGCRIGEGVHIGRGSVLHPNVTIYHGVRVGSRAVLHAGCVLGADGFGFSLVGDHWEKFPQVGTVEIGDDVEIGANACIDRAALGTTFIGQGSKIDNLVHIAHNCKIGKHVVIAAQTGFSGGVTVGDYAALGGQVGIGPKARIDSKAEVAAKSGILTSQRIAAGQPVWGIPARPLRQHLKGLANVARLPETINEIKEMKKRIELLEKELEKGSS